MIFKPIIGHDELLADFMNLIRKIPHLSEWQFRRSMAQIVSEKPNFLLSDQRISQFMRSDESPYLGKLVFARIQKPNLGFGASPLEKNSYHISELDDPVTIPRMHPLWLIPRQQRI